ncbi:hypothetical protein [Methylovirgula sp. 4M-Z18]|nr:hypothetical protein [Methylovirgula sp. 4M-Z18]
MTGELPALSASGDFGHFALLVLRQIGKALVSGQVGRQIRKTRVNNRQNA